MSFEISKNRILFPQPGRLLSDSSVYQLLDRSMKYPRIIEEGVNQVYTVGRDLGVDGIDFFPPLPKIFFSKTYDKIPYIEFLTIQNDHSDIGYYYNPISAHPRQWQTSLVLEKDGFTFSFDNFFGGRGGPSGRFDFTYYWAIYDIDYIPEVA